MPSYRYFCHKCNKEFEATQKNTDSPLEIHDNCGGGELERLMPKSVGIRFKGKGFASNDLKSDKIFV